VGGRDPQEELANWPAPPGRDDSTRYVEALAATQGSGLVRAPCGPEATGARSSGSSSLPGARPAFSRIGLFEIGVAEHPVRFSELRAAGSGVEPTRGYCGKTWADPADAFHVRGSRPLEALLSPLALLRGGRRSDAGKRCGVGGLG